METKELIKLLNSKVIELKEQINSISNTINVLSNSHPKTGEIIPHIKQVSNKRTVKRNGAKKTGGLKEKIFQALNIIHKGSVNDIFNEISKTEKIKDNKKTNTCNRKKEFAI